MKTAVEAVVKVITLLSAFNELNGKVLAYILLLAPFFLSRPGVRYSSNTLHVAG